MNFIFIRLIRIVRSKFHCLA